MFRRLIKKAIVICLVLCLVPTSAFAYTKPETEPNDTFESATKIDRWSDYEGSISNQAAPVEREPNNWFNTAKELRPNCNGELGNNDSDYYYFNVREEGKVDIFVHNKRSADINWKVYKETDLNTCVAYLQTSGEYLSGSFDAEPGRYYVVVYDYSEIPAHYYINVNGPVESGDIDTYKIIPGEFTLPMGPGDLGIQYCSLSVRLEIEDQTNDFDLYVYNEEGILVDKETTEGNDTVRFSASRGRYDVFYIQVVPKIGSGEYTLDISRYLPPSPPIGPRTR